MPRDEFALSGLPRISILGTAVYDAELRFTPAGKAIGKLRLASNERRKEGDSWVDGDSCFLDVTAFGPLAENVCDKVTKGTRVLVTGRLKQREWTTDDGQKRSAYEVVADDIGIQVSPFADKPRQTVPANDDPWAKPDPWAEEPPF